MMEDAFYQVEAGDFFVEPAMLNHLNILHGGVLVKQCDSTVGVVANRYAHSRVLTVAIKEFNFSQPAHVGDHISFSVTLLKTGHHTMTFHVEVRRQTFKGELEKIGAGIFIFVAVDENLRPVKVKPLVVQNVEHNTAIDQMKASFSV